MIKQLPIELERKILDYKYELIHTSYMKKLRPIIKTNACFMKAKWIMNEHMISWVQNNTLQSHEEIMEDINEPEQIENDIIDCIIKNTTYDERFKMMITFDKCNCCIRHNKCRPGPMDYSMNMDVDDKNMFPKNIILTGESNEELINRIENNPNCKCICRSMSRNICRSQLTIENYYNPDLESSEYDSSEYDSSEYESENESQENPSNAK